MKCSRFFALAVSLSAGCIEQASALDTEVDAGTNEWELAPALALETNCPALGGLATLPLPSVEEGGGALRPAQMAFSRSGDKLFIAYQGGVSPTTHPGQVHVRDLRKCTQRVLVSRIQTPLGIAVHPWFGTVYVTHLEAGRSAVSIFDPQSGALLVDKFVSGLPASDIAFGTTGNGAQGLTFDSAGNLYIAMNLNVKEEHLPDYKASGLLKVDGAGNVSVFAHGLRATFEAVIAHTNHRGEATGFYAGDNGEGDRCIAIDPHCTISDAPRASRMYYDELNYLVHGAHYGYPESAPGHPSAIAGSRDHVGPLWSFDKRSNPPFQDLSPVPTGLALAEGKWGDAYEPLFLAFWRGGVDMFTGPNRTTRTPLVTNLNQVIDVALAPKSQTLFISEYTTGLIYTLTPKRLRSR